MAIDIVPILEIILLLLVWHTLGALILCFTPFTPLSVPSKAAGFEFVNPVFIYNNTKVNWFGAVVLMLFFSFLCPIGAIGYWFYKLCVVGRKELEN